MFMSLPYDTHQLYEDLRKDGVDDVTANKVVGLVKTVATSLQEDAEQRYLNKPEAQKQHNTIIGAMAALEAKIDTRFAKIDTRFAEIGAKMDTHFAKMDAKLERSKNTIILWTVSYTTALAALLFAAAKFIH